MEEVDDALLSLLLIDVFFGGKGCGVLAAKSKKFMAGGGFFFNVVSDLFEVLVVVKDSESKDDFVGDFSNSCLGTTLLVGFLLGRAA
jgi:hypothetical protein